MYDAVVVGAGPNGLAAAAELARNGKKVLLVERAGRIGGGAQTEALTLAGFRHDVCSSVHPLGAASPYFSSLPLERYGLDWVRPDVAFAHPLEGQTGIHVEGSVEQTAELLGSDRRRYELLMGALVEGIDGVMAGILRPPLRALDASVVQFGLRAWAPATVLGGRFRTPEAKALLAGCAGHAIAPIDQLFTSAVALPLLATAHTVGWPVAKGGSQSISDALGAYFLDLGGEIIVDFDVRSLVDLPPHRVVLFDLTPRQILAIAGDVLGGRVRRAFDRYQYGWGSFKVDWALSGPIPWSYPPSRRTATVHVGGTLQEIVRSEAEVAAGRHAERPFVLVTQPSVVDPTRTPHSKHVAWGYCHVPHGSSRDMTATIEAQIERFAPGFGDLIEARHTMGPAELEAHNPNYVGGDVAGGASSVRQLLARPMMRWDPYRLPVGDMYVCSSSTPPGAGVHGMCGYNAARSVLRHSLTG